MRECDAVVHLAAVPSVPRSIADPVTSHEANATGTLNVLLAARDAGASRIVLASSSSIYGANPALPKRESLTPLPMSPYAVSKLAGESYGRSFYEVYGLETVALRYFNVFGPRQDPNSEYAAVIPKFIWALRNGEPPVIFGDGEQSRDFTYVENVVDANIAALERPDVGGRIYNIACGRRITLNALAQSLREELGSSVEVVHGPARPGDVRHSVADVSLAEAELGYDPKVGLAEGLRRTVAYFVAEEANTTKARTPAISPRRTGSERSRPGVPAAEGEPRRPTRDGRRFVITGGAGFIGSHLVQALMESGQAREIVILDDLSTGRLENIEHVLGDDRVRFVEGSVTNAELVDELMEGADICVHLASAVGVQMIVNEPLDTLMRSVRGSNVVMHAASRHDVRVLFSSTSEVYGKQTNGALTEDSDLIFGSPSKGRWTYAIAKSFGEALIYGYHGHARGRRHRRTPLQHGRPAPDRRLRHGASAVRPPGPAWRRPDRLRHRRPDPLLHPRARHRRRAGAAVRQRERERQDVQHRQLDLGHDRRARTPRDRAVPERQRPAPRALRRGVRRGLRGTRGPATGHDRAAQLDRLGNAPHGGRRDRRRDRVRTDS